MSARDVIATTLTAIETDTMPCKRCNGYGYHHGFGEHGHDPDWCEECHGPGFVMAHDATKTPDIIIAALTAAGFTIAPNEPTEAMIKAAHDGPLMAGDHEIGPKQREWLSAMWSAMLSATNQRDANNDR